MSLYVAFAKSKFSSSHTEPISSFTSLAGEVAEDVVVFDVVDEDEDVVVDDDVEGDIDEGLVVVGVDVDCDVVEDNLVTGDADVDDVEDVVVVEYVEDVSVVDDVEGGVVVDVSADISPGVVASPTWDSGT